MGGSIAITFRDSDGTVEKMCRWTNTMPYYLVNHLLYTKNKYHVEKWMKQWNDMKIDWDSNVGKKKPNYKHEMTEVYARTENRVLAPIGYGLVVVDFMNNKILHNQGYCSLNALNVSMSIITAEDADDDERKLVDLLYNNRVVDIDGRTKKEPWAKNKSPRQVVERILEAKRNAVKHKKVLKEDSDAFFSCVRVSVDTKPFEVIKYEETENGFREMYKDIKKLDFKLTKEEEAQWQEYYKRYED